MSYFFLSILILVFVILIIIEIAVFLFVLVGLRNKVPFVPTPKEVLESIAKNLNLHEGSVVYDLGCGNGKILFYLFKSNQNIKCVGFENNFLPLAWARLKLFLASKKEKESIKIINGNFFKHDFKEATHIFTYLSGEAMDRLLPKFEKELRVGSRLVSLSFPFKNKKPIEVVGLNRRKTQLARELYMYEF